MNEDLMKKIDEVIIVLKHMGYNNIKPEEDFTKRKYQIINGLLKNKKRSDLMFTLEEIEAMESYYAIDIHEENIDSKETFEQEEPMEEPEEVAEEDRDSDEEESIDEDLEEESQMSSENSSDSSRDDGQEILQRILDEVDLNRETYKAMSLEERINYIHGYLDQLEDYRTLFMNAHFNQEISFPAEYAYLEDLLTTELKGMISAQNDKEQKEPEVEAEELSKEELLDGIQLNMEKWKSLWRGKKTVGEMLEWILNEQSYEFEVFEWDLTEEEEEYASQYFEKLRNAESFIRSFEENYSDLTTMKCKEFLKLLSKEEKNEFINLFIEKENIFQKVADFVADKWNSIMSIIPKKEKSKEKVSNEKNDKYGDYLAYGYYKNCKDLLQKDASKLMNIDDVESFQKQSSETIQNAKEYIGDRNPDEVLDLESRVAVGTAKENTKSLTDILEKVDGFETSKSFYQYMNALSNEKKEEWNKVLTRSKDFVKGFKKLSWKRKVSMANHYDKIAHPKRRKFVFASLVVATAATVLTAGIRHFGNKNNSSDKGIKTETIQPKEDSIKIEVVEDTNDIDHLEVEMAGVTYTYNTSNSNHQEVKQKSVKYQELEEMKESLKEVQKALNFENIENPETITFGSLVVTDDDAKIYKDIISATEGLNGQHAKYNSEEGKLVESIFLSKDGEVINTHDIEEYQKSVNAGFKVEGYTLVNQHSLDKNGNLVIEGRFQAEDVSLVRKTK